MNLRQHFLNAMTAAAFAEAAEFDTALEMTAVSLNNPTRIQAISPIQQQWAAVAFAEAGEFDTARGMLQPQPKAHTGQSITPLTEECSPCQTA